MQTITTIANYIKELAGSVAIPNRFKGLDTKEMVNKAKDEYFLDKTKQKTKPVNLKLSIQNF